jgi:WD40 repeat protein
VSGSLDGTMCKWDCDTGLLVGEPWKGDGGHIWALALSPDGRTMAYRREDGSVQRWNTGGEMIEGVWTGHSENVRSLLWSPTGSHLASRSRDGTILIRKARRGEVAVGPIKTNHGSVGSLAYSPSGDRIASGGRNGTIEGGYICALALSPDGRMIACGREDGSVQRWNTDGEMIEGVWTGHSGNVLSLSWSHTGSHLASGSRDGTILIRKAQSGEVAVGPIKTNHGSVSSLAYSPSGDRIASGGRNRTICIWDSSTGELLVGPIEDLRETVASIVWSSDGSKLYSASDELARVFESVSGTLLHRFPHHYSIWSVALSPKHNVLACVGTDVAQLWDTETYEPLGHPFHQDGNAYFVSFSPNGRYLACGGNDKKVTLWMVQDIAPQLVPESPSSLCLDVSTLTFTHRPAYRNIIG